MYRLVFFLLLLFTVYSCVNDIEKIKKITFKKGDPTEKMTELYLTHSDSGMAKIRLYAPLAESFNDKEKILKFREGLKVEFYKDNGSLMSILTAKYGEINETTGTMEARDSVHFFNPIKNQRLETEALFWSKADSIIYTNESVVIRTPTALFFGKGLRTKQDFSSYEFIRPQGKINIDSKK